MSGSRKSYFMNSGATAGPGALYRILVGCHRDRISIALSALSRKKAALGSRFNRSWCCSVRVPSWGTRPQIFTFTLAKSFALAVFSRRTSTASSSLDSTSFSSLAEPPRRIRTRPRALAAVCRRPAVRIGCRNHPLVRIPAHHPACACYHGRVPCSCSLKPEWQPTLSLPARHAALHGNAHLHRRMVLA